MVGITSVVVLGIQAAYFQINKSQKQSNLLYQVGMFNKNIGALVAMQTSWNATVNAPANRESMACIRLRRPCTSDGSASGQPLEDVLFAIFDGAGKEYYNPLNEHSGVTLSGVPCSTFSASGNESCPIRIELKWSAICQPGNCMDPQIKVKAEMKIAPTVSGILINPANHSMPDVYRYAQ